MPLEGEAKLKYMREVYYPAHRAERIKRAKQQWQEEKGDKLALWVKRIKLRYNLTPADYDALFERQHGECAICHNPLEYRGKNTHIDHEHGTKHVRGLLCRGCNQGLGNFGDCVAGLERAIAYLNGEN